MTQEAQRIAIAGLLPNLIHVETSNVLNPDQPMETTFLWKDTELIRDWYPVKERDWLWIMHEAEKTLSLKQREVYYDELGKVSGWLTVCATAAQRTEAFLRTIGLWKSS